MPKKEGLPERYKDSGIVWLGSAGSHCKEPEVMLPWTNVFCTDESISMELVGDNIELPIIFCPCEESYTPIPSV